MIKKTKEELRTILINHLAQRGRMPIYDEIIYIYNEDSDGVFNTINFREILKEVYELKDI